MIVNLYIIFMLYCILLVTTHVNINYAFLKIKVLSSRKTICFLFCRLATMSLSDAASHSLRYMYSFTIQFSKDSIVLVFQALDFHMTGFKFLWWSDSFAKILAVPCDIVALTRLLFMKCIMCSPFFYALIYYIQQRILLPFQFLENRKY